MYIVPFFVTALRMPEYPFNLRFEKMRGEQYFVGLPYYGSRICFLYKHNQCVRKENFLCYTPKSFCGFYLNFFRDELLCSKKQRFWACLASFFVSQKIFSPV